jgi:hypothetical protein
MENENDVMRRIRNGNRWNVKLYVYLKIYWNLKVIRRINVNGNVI